jgi:type IV pilus assembly protein PilV
MEALVTLQNQRSQRGALMIEVLITIVILAIGLLGMMQMQGRLQKSEMESYQRTQAVMLVNDMASRISTNRNSIVGYLTSGLSPAYLGLNGNNIPCDSTLLADGLQLGDSGEWCRALEGAGEVQAGSNVGAMVGGRGCVEFDATTNQYMVTVVWQGLTPISAPPTSVTCGANLYNLPLKSPCADIGNEDKCRRYVTTIITEGIWPP